MGLKISFYDDLLNGKIIVGKQVGSKPKGEVVSEYTQKESCSEETAEQYLTVAHFNHSQVSLHVTTQDENGEETGEDVTRDDSWDYATIRWNGAQAAAVQAAFEKLTYREQRLLEERNAICMTLWPGQSAVGAQNL